MKLVVPFAISHLYPVTLACLSTICCLAADEILDQRITPRYARADFRLDPSPGGFDCEQIEIASTIFKQQHPGLRLYLLRFSGQDQACEAGIFRSHVPYSALLEFRKRGLSLSANRNCAEAVITLFGSSIRIREDSGKVLQCVTGQNPLVVDVGDAKISIAWLQYGSVQLPREEMLSVFGISKELNISQAEKAYFELMARFPAQIVDLTVRPIPWFPSNSYFPLIYDYGDQFEPPNELESDGIPSINCGFSKGPPNCVGLGNPKGIAK